MITVRHAIRAATGAGFFGLGVLVSSPADNGLAPPGTDLFGDRTATIGSAHESPPPSPFGALVPATAVNAVDAITAASPTGGAGAPAGRVLAYATPDTPMVGPGVPNPATAEPPPILVDTTGVREAIAAYRSGDLAAGDLAAATTTNPLASTTVAWAALHLQRRQMSPERIGAFLNAHPDWPTVDFLKGRAEESIWGDRRPAAFVQAYFAKQEPTTTLGRLALARADMAAGDTAAATGLVRAVWREADFSAALEASVRKDFGSLLTKADHKYRSDRLFYKDKTAASLRIAAYAGTDVLALAQARESLSDKAIAALAPDLKKDPTLTFARIGKLIHDNKIADAAQLMLAAPRDANLLVNGDEWWIQRRTLARKLLDMGDPKNAYRLCAEHGAEARDLKIEAEFHAGWIALRYLSDPTTAARHFAQAASQAITPISLARTAYWQGRAAADLGDTAAAEAFFRSAGKQSSTYYGQLAMARLGDDKLPVRRPTKIARGDDRAEAVRVIELLDALDERDLAAPIAVAAARHFTDDAQIAALGDVLTHARDARTTLIVGKLAAQRGFALDEVAFPTFGIPSYEPLARSASAAVVYAVARQESAFEPRAVSSAGAKGLMQMITSTARRTAQLAGVAFDENRLLNDPAFNAQLGAAHLGILLNEQRGSLILTFAAYNAGGRRVKEWIAAHGDPRDPGVDAIDWVERIPFNETRNYVQRVIENFEMYRARLGNDKLELDADLHTIEAKM